jgi:methanethiol oxidase
LSPVRARPALRLAWALVVAAGCGGPSPDEVPYAGEPYLAVWAGDHDRADPDFLAMIDVEPRSRRYATVVATVPVGSRGNEPHGLGPLRADGRLMATGVRTSRVFTFDVRDPSAPELHHVEEGARRWLHSAPTHVVGRARGALFVTCPDRRDYRGTPYEILDAPGGLVIVDDDGRAVEELSGATKEARAFIVAPSDGAVVPGNRRLVTTNRGHGFATTSTGPFMPGITVQVWPVQGRRPEATIVLEAGPRGSENLGPDAIAVLARRPFVFVATADGGALYGANFVGETIPGFRLLHDFGADARPAALATTPNDRFLVVALAGTGTIAVLDVRNPYVPAVVSTVELPGRGAAGPGALAVSADGSRIAVSTYGIETPTLQEPGTRRVYLLRLDGATGAVRIDGAFRDELSGDPGLDFRRAEWPHGRSGAARPAGLRFVVPLPPDR